MDVTKLSGFFVKIKGYQPQQGTNKTCNIVKQLKFYPSYMCSYCLPFILF